MTIYFEYVFYYRCIWNNWDRLSTSALLLAALLKGFRFLHNKISIPPEYLDILLWSIVVGIIWFMLDLASLFFLLVSVCGGEGVWGSPYLTPLDLSKSSNHSQLLLEHNNNLNQTMDSAQNASKIRSSHLTHVVRAPKIYKQSIRGDGSYPIGNSYNIVIKVFNCHKKKNLKCLVVKNQK